MSERPQEKLLPVGSVLSLKDDGRRYVVIGRGVVSQDRGLWDYALAEYPFGLVSSMLCTFASSDQVDRVIAKGYEDEMSIGLGELIVDLREGRLTREELEEKLSALIGSTPGAQGMEA